MRSLDFTACTKDCPIDCWRKLTKEEKEWLENNPNRMSYTSECSEQEEQLELFKELDNSNV